MLSRFRTVAAATVDEAYPGSTGVLCGGSTSECDGTLESMSATVNVNGRITDDAHAVVSVFDHGFLYGEGVYETLRTYNGQPFLFDRHMRRLRTSAGMLALQIPLSNDDIDRRFRDTMRAAGLEGGPNKEAYIRLLVTRGVGDLSYDPAVCPNPSFVVIVKRQVDPAKAAYEEGVSVIIASTVRNHPGTVNPLIKSNNLINNALAGQEAIRRGVFEAVMRNYRGELAECTTSNLFIVRNGVALTPPLESGLLPGITRECLFELAAEQKIPMRAAILRDEDLFDADEAFLTSTTRELVPIVRVDDRPIGDGKPGPVTLTLLETFRRKAEELTRTEVRG
jgi:branched-chain amino acid aminotransferase